MSLFTQFTGSARPALQYFITTSKTFTVPLSGTYLIYAIGGGGGASLCGQSNNNPRPHATGAGAGGLAIKETFLNAGTALTITIGAGGAVGAGTDSATTYSGGNGGATTVNGGGISLTANGGSGGVGAGTGATQVITTAGGTGGTASGGDANFTGGAGGSITQNQLGSAQKHRTGGGSVSFYGEAYTGGNITRNYAGVNPHNYQTGGAGVGGNGGNLIINTDLDGNTSGGGSGGSASSIDITNANTQRAGIGIEGAGDNYNSSNCFFPCAPGQTQASNTFIPTIGYGGGSGAIPNTNVSGNMRGLGGAGANADANDVYIPQYGGGAGGGLSNGTGGTGGSAGGSGLVMIARV